LKSDHTRACESSAQEWIFTGAFVMRPQRASRAISTIGANVQRSPVEYASLAAMPAERFRQSRIQLLASAKGMERSCG